MDKAMVNRLIAQAEAIYEHEELFDIGAKAMKMSVDALRRAKFSREEAIQIVAQQGSLVTSSS